MSIDARDTEAPMSPVIGKVYLIDDRDIDELEIEPPGTVAEEDVSEGVVLQLRPRPEPEPAVSVWDVSQLDFGEDLLQEYRQEYDSCVNGYGIYPGLTFYEWLRNEHLLLCMQLAGQSKGMGDDDVERAVAAFDDFVVTFPRARGRTLWEISCRLIRTYTSDTPPRLRVRIEATKGFLAVLEAKFFGPEEGIVPPELAGDFYSDPDKSS